MGRSGDAPTRRELRSQLAAAGLRPVGSGRFVAGRSWRAELTVRTGAVTCLLTRPDGTSERFAVTAGVMPHLARLLQEGCVASPESITSLRWPTHNDMQVAPPTGLVKDRRDLVTRPL